MAPRLNKAWHLPKLLAADGSLKVCHFQVVAEMAVDVLVIVSAGQQPMLAIEAMTAEIIVTGGTDAITPPVPHAFADTRKHGIISVDTSTLAHGHMVRGIKAGGTDIADGPGIVFLSVQHVHGAQRVAVVLYQP